MYSYFGFLFDLPPVQYPFEHILPCPSYLRPVLQSIWHGFRMLLVVQIQPYIYRPQFRPMCLYRERKWERESVNEIVIISNTVNRKMYQNQMKATTPHRQEEKKSTKKWGGMEKDENSNNNKDDSKKLLTYKWASQKNRGFSLVISYLFGVFFYLMHTTFSIAHTWTLPTKTRIHTPFGVILFSVLWCRVFIPNHPVYLLLLLDFNIQCVSIFVLFFFLQKSNDNHCLHIIKLTSLLYLLCKCLVFVSCHTMHRILCTVHLTFSQFS